MLVPGNNLPGIDPSIETVENEFTWGPNGLWANIGAQINSTATDSGSSPTTLLRKGLVMGQITATGLYAQYNPAASDGTQEPIGILYDSVNMIDLRTGTVRNKSAPILWLGPIKVNQVYGFDEYARMRLGNRIWFDDLRFTDVPSPAPVAKAANYTVLTTDTGKTFTNTGASGAVTFTLPAAARGLRYRFYVTAGQNVTVTAPAGTMVTFNNAAATSSSFQTAGNLIGGTIDVFADDTGAKWCVVPIGANTLTVA